jgi:outer membrane protein
MAQKLFIFWTEVLRIKNLKTSLIMKNITLTILCLLILTVFFSVHGQENSAGLTLQNCIDKALYNNISIKQSELLEEAGHLNHNQAKYNRLPNVAAGYNYGINNGRSIDPFTNFYLNQQLTSSNANLTASLPVFRGFQLQQSVKQASLTHEATKMELQQEKDNLTLNVILAFLQLMNDEDVLKLSRQQIEVTQNQAERLKQLNEEGAISPSDFFDMKGQLSSEQLAVLNAVRSVENSKLGLTQLMNIPYSKDFKIDRSDFDMTIAFYEGTVDQFYSSALQNLAMIKATDMRTEAAAKGIKVAQADFYPRITLFGQLGTNYSSAARISTFVNTLEVPSGDYVVLNNTNVPVITQRSTYKSQEIKYFNQLNNNLNTYLGVNVQFPIFSSFQVRTNVRLAGLEEKRNRYIADNTKILLLQAIEQAQLNMTTAWERFQILKEQVTAFEESFRAAEIRFNLGASNSVEFLIVKNNIDRANINLTIAQYEYLLRTKVLDFYRGTLK